ncbi:ubiquitin supergroup protein [Diplodia corticola]|uniref:Ubiquitin supergroup protein n=1 Tax=Diplodia corticola TaxID=236234 RepID=A0A1J9RQ60_9PEZI|nr:ubiquitin supergroup protein [Diplodia corticola]OJD30044.1 ubiquitin supergroup protein [Diplodia corticola]
MTELSFAKQFLTALEARPARLSSDHVVDPKSYPAQPAFILPRMPQPKRKPTDSRTADSTTTTDQPAPASAPEASSTSALATVTLKPTRSTLPTHTLPHPVSTATTSIHDLKAAYAAFAAGSGGLSTTKIKILHAKKPVNDTKTISDVLGSDAASATGTTPISVEFSVMVLGGSGTTPTTGGNGTPAISTPERLASPPVAVPAVAPPPTEPVTEPVTEPPTGSTEALLPPSQPEIEMGEAPPVGGEADGSSAEETLRTDGFWDDLKGFLVQRLKDEGEGERLAGVFREAWAGAGAQK